MSLDEVREMLTKEPTVPLWPDAGKALGLTRNHTYAAAIKGDIQVLKFGRLKRVPTAWLRQKLGFDTA